MIRSAKVLSTTCNKRKKVVYTTRTIGSTQEVQSYYSEFHAKQIIRLICYLMIAFKHYTLSSSTEVLLNDVTVMYSHVQQKAPQLVL